jgi:hypothetical protein
MSGMWAVMSIQMWKKNRKNSLNRLSQRLKTSETTEKIEYES